MTSEPEPGSTGSAPNRQADEPLANIVAQVFTAHGGVTSNERPVCAALLKVITSTYSKEGRGAALVKVCPLRAAA